MPGLQQPPNERHTKTPSFDSLLGESSKHGGVLDHREYVIYCGAQAFPLFLVWYQHEEGCSCFRCRVTACHQAELLRSPLQLDENRFVPNEMGFRPMTERRNCLHDDEDPDDDSAVVLLSGPRSSTAPAAPHTRSKPARRYATSRPPAVPAPRNRVSSNIEPLQTTSASYSGEVAGNSQSTDCRKAVDCERPASMVFQRLCTPRVSAVNSDKTCSTPASRMGRMRAGLVSRKPLASRTGGSPHHAASRRQPTRSALSQA